MLAALLLLFGVPRVASAKDEASVPFELQAKLLGKVAGYDKNLRERAGDRVRILIVQKAGDGASERAARQLSKALDEIDEIGGLPHDERVVAWSGVDALLAEIKRARVTIVYLTPGLGNHAEAVAKKLKGADVLSVSAVAEHVPRRIVLGFGLVSGKPKIFCHLDQARLQNVEFEPRALKLMTVYR